MKINLLILSFLTLFTNHSFIGKENNTTNSILEKMPVYNNAITPQKKWYINYNEVDFSEFTPEVFRTPFAPAPFDSGSGSQVAGIAHGLHDQNGLLKYYTVWIQQTTTTGERFDLYSSNGTMIGTIDQLNPFSSEMAILPFDCDGKPFSIIIYDRLVQNTSGHTLAFALIDDSNNTIVDTYTVESFGFGGPPPAFALSPEKNGVHFLYSTDSNREVKKYIVNPSLCSSNTPENIIQADQDNPVVFTAPFQIRTTELELSPDQKHLAYGAQNGFQVTILELDVNGDYVTQESYNLPTQGDNPFSVNGLEFNGTSSRVFVSYDLIGGNSGIYTLSDLSGNGQFSFVNGTSDSRMSHIEMAPDGFLYAGTYSGPDVGSALIRIDPDTGNELGAYSIPVRLPFQGQVYGENGIFTLPDLIDCPAPVETVCSDFNDQTQGTWSSIGSTVSILNPGPSGASTDYYIRAVDQSGVSYLFNGVDYTGNWLEMADDCLCYDYNIISDGSAGDVFPVARQIGIMVSTNNIDPWTNATRRAVFEMNFSINETGDWLELCAPIGQCDASGNLPFNEYGQWRVLDGGDCNDWNSLITGVTHIGLFYDLPRSTETYEWDNVCFKECQELPINTTCEGLTSSASPVMSDMSEENCCHSISIANNGQEIYSGVNFTIRTPNVEYEQFNVNGPGIVQNNDFLNTNRVLGITAPNNIFPDTYDDVVDMCLKSIDGSTLPAVVEVEVAWLLPFETGIEYIPCKQILTLRCGEPEPIQGCCDSLANEIVNGDFEFGREGFESEYSFEPDISVSSILPGSYGVINTQEANSICDNWMVDDHTTNCDGAGNFLVVNGRTGQTGSSIFWEQTIQVADTSDTYKLCASFKHLEQCCFDVIPVIDIIINGIRIDSITINETMGADPCSWQDITYTFTPDDFSVTIQFALQETALGDGNDLAVDDIIISKLPKAPFYISTQDQRPQTSNIMASIFTIAPPTGPIPDDILPSPECKYEWMVAPVTDIDFGTSPVTISTGTIDVGGPFSTPNPTWGLTTTFPGYGGGTPDGTFGNGFFYIAMTVYDCDCYADSTDAKIVGRFGLKLPDGGDLENFVLSDDSKQAINTIRNGAYSENVPTTILFNQADINKLNNGPSLQQNEPNPFDNSTTIAYFLPEDSQSAILRITGIDGSVLQTIPIEQKGTGQVRVNSTQYLEGVYFYSLVIDDRIVETKRMVLTR